MSKILAEDKMQIVGTLSEGVLYRFTPSPFRLFPRSGKMHRMNIEQCIRFYFLLLHGYRVYVLANKKDDVLGCVMFANGGSYRYPFASKKDLICGPYYIVPEYRNKGIAKCLLSEVITNYETEYEMIWAHIWYTNVASIKCMEKVGFKQVGKLMISKILHKCVVDENGHLVLVSLAKSDAGLLKERQNV